MALISLSIHYHKLHKTIITELNGATDFVPGVVALFLLLRCTMMTAMSIVRKKEMGMMEYC